MAERFITQGIEKAWMGVMKFLYNFSHIVFGKHRPITYFSTNHNTNVRYLDDITLLIFSVQHNYMSRILSDGWQQTKQTPI